MCGRRDKVGNNVGEERRGRGEKERRKRGEEKERVGNTRRNSYHIVIILVNTCSFFCTPIASWQVGLAVFLAPVCCQSYQVLI